MSKFLLMVFLLSVFSLSGAEKIVWQSDFSKNPTLKGWRINVKPNRASYQVEKNSLAVRSSGHYREDGYIETDVPLCKSGRLDFDAKVNTGSVAIPGPGIYLELYNITTFWHDSVKDWRYYFPQPNSKREKGFELEPSGHGSIASLRSKHGWIHYRIVFDESSDRVEFYIDDMDNPAYITTAHSVWGRDEYQGGKLRIGSLGYSSPNTCLVANIELRENNDENNELSIIKRTQILIFNGISFNQYRLPECLAGELIQQYNMDSTHSMPLPVNAQKFANFPGQKTIAQAKTIILVDTPLGPGDIFPEFIQKDIINTVQAGAKLLILGGLYTLNKGEYQGSHLERILPIELGTPWDMSYFSQPQLIQATSEQFANVLTKPNEVEVVHKLKLAPDAQVHLTTQAGMPLLVSRSCGKGEVWVFGGTVCGTSEKLFWKTSDWQRIIRKLISQ